MAAPSAAAIKAFSLGSQGYQPSVDDVARLSCSTAQQLQLDGACAARLKQESPAPKAFVHEAPPSSTSPSPSEPPTEDGLPPLYLGPAQTSAVVLTKVLSLVHGKSTVRVQLVEYLLKLLNSGVLPALPADATADAEVLNQLADAAHGVGIVLPSSTASAAAPPASSDQASANSTTAATAATAATVRALGTERGVRGTEASRAWETALAGAGIDPPGLSAAERLALTSGASAAAGLLTLTVQGAKQLLAVATAVLALSCEALGAPTKAFEADIVEAHSYAAAVAVADDLRGFLEGSKRTNTLKGGEELRSFSSAPQRLGAASEAVAAAYSAVRAEVQSAALPAKGTASQTCLSPVLPARGLELARSLLTLARDSLARTKRVAPDAALLAALPSVMAVLDDAQKATAAVGTQLLADSDQPVGVAVAMAAAGALEAAVQAAALEGLVAVATLRTLEGPPVAAAAPEAEAAAAPAAEEDGKKAKKGKDKKGGAVGLVLGKGSASIRAYLEQAMAGGAASLPLSVDGTCEGTDLTAAWRRGAAALAPLVGPLPKFLEELRTVLEANQARRKPKIPKGTRDFLPEQMAIREKAFNTITAVFKRHGAVAIDTPVFELRETLTGKYGEDSKLIYNLEDQGGEILSLRYDLTVPFARFVAVHGVGNLKRYHVGKVYRRDQPQMNRGRFREFFQCDFDIAGSYAAVMVPDAEVIKVVTEIITDLQLGAFVVKVNHRRLLDSMLKIAGVPAQKFRPICAAIDKLDKEEWATVKAEMVEDKGLPEEAADIIGKLVENKGPPLELLPKLLVPGHPLYEDADGRAALEELQLLFGYLSAMGALDTVRFDLSLARGLDYYTGVIYEVVLTGADVGSIAGGGRYDKLVGMFSGKDVPAVGVSVGIERVFAIMEAQMIKRAEESGVKLRSAETQVLVASIGNNMQSKRMAICASLWAAGIKSEFGFKANPKMADSLETAIKESIPFMVLFGDSELEQGVVKVKDMAAKTEDVVPSANLVADLLRRIAAAATASDTPATAAAAASDDAAVAEAGSKLAQLSTDA